MVAWLTTLRNVNHGVWNLLTFGFNVNSSLAAVFTEKKSFVAHLLRHERRRQA